MANQDNAVAGIGKAADLGQKLGPHHVVTLAVASIGFMGNVQLVVHINPAVF
ncbi:hypothetical protein SDC9_208832 [bioreactor metagenome]|uniref:Uncharacterized protein n=1 Tax=bioreactor metagenome TaxID=1076179 RepID=A0A645JBN6_9ZZZZ